MKGKKSVKKGVWYIRRKRKQGGKGFSTGLLVSAAVPIRGDVAKPYEKIFGGRKRRR